jgi:aspartyl-tRNA(Asn)/glutamyl-tRNA(Gln) amidotransferase subunit B
MPAAAFETVIGLEVHVRLDTATKMFCGCALDADAERNTRTCPVCLGLPGSLPTVNERALSLGMTLGLGLSCDIAPRLAFHRKHYLYPDLPKGYQVTQHDEPLCSHGGLDGVRINRVHLEEDAAKLIHVGASGRIHGSDASIVDFNRGGAPLAEVVTEPDLRSPERAGEWLRLLHATVTALGVSDARMEDGSLRCDANISLRPAGAEGLGVKTELKNMNSFRLIERALRAEAERQRLILEAGGVVEPQTLHYDEATGTVTPMRSKEEAHDYRYFPEPDLPPAIIGEEALAGAREARAACGELPAQRAARFEGALSLPTERARRLAFHTELGDYFEGMLAAPSAGAAPEALASWLDNDLMPRLGRGADPSTSLVSPEALASLASIVASGEVSVGSGRHILDVLVAHGGDPLDIIEAEGLSGLSTSELEALVDDALLACPEAAQRVGEGHPQALGPVVGHVMRAAAGRADGAEATALIKARLGI